MRFNRDRTNRLRNFFLNISILASVTCWYQKLFFPGKLINQITHSSGIQWTTHKHLSMITKLDFQEHCKYKVIKTSKEIGLLRKLHRIITIPPLLTICKSIIRPYLDYGDIIYDKAWNTSGAIRGTSKEKLCQNSGLESVEKKRWYRKLFIRCILFL